MTTVIVVVVVTTVSGCLPTTMPVFPITTRHEGAAVHVPLNVTTQPEAGTPDEPIVIVMALSDPATAGDVPQLLEQVGEVDGV